MYDQFLRHSTNSLQDDLRTELKAYTFEKERLASQLLHLGCTDVSDTSLSGSSNGDNPGNNSPRKSQYFRAPNMSAMTPTNPSISSRSEPVSDLFRTPERKMKDKKDQLEKLKKDKDLLKLPVILSASSRRSEWESGKFQGSQTSFPALEPLPGISAAKEFLVDSMKIPSIHDPQRTDTHFRKGRKHHKKVTFADENDGLLLHVNHIEAHSVRRNSKASKNSSGKGPVPKLNLTANQFSHTAKPKRPRKTSLLPPLQFLPSDVRENPQRVTEGINQWKEVYGNIINPEEKMRALTDIMNAVRLKKFENEQAMKYGDGPRPSDDEILKEFMGINAVDNITYRTQSGHVSNTSIRFSRDESAFE